MSMLISLLLLAQSPACPGGLCGVPYAPYYPAGAVYMAPIRGAYGHHPDCPDGVARAPVSPAYGATGGGRVGVGLMPVIPLRPPPFTRPRRSRQAIWGPTYYIEGPTWPI